VYPLRRLVQVWGVHARRITVRGKGNESNVYGDHRRKETKHHSRRKFGRRVVGLNLESGKASPPLALEMTDVGMTFGKTVALRNVSFTVSRGEIHALVGHNGAGKSTLMKLAMGVYKPTSGEVRIGGKVLTGADPSEARDLGLRMVFQERSLIHTLNGRDNIFLGEERTGLFGSLRQRVEEEQAADLLLRLGISRALLTRAVSEMSPIEQEMIEIAKAMLSGKEVLILDEPTAPLGDKEIGVLFDVLRNTAEQGTAVVLITHHLMEVFSVSDRVSCLREGEVTLSARATELTLDDLVNAILGQGQEGRESDHAGRANTTNHQVDYAARPILQVRHLSDGRKLRGVSFDLRPGEIIGIAGLAGSGRTTLLRLLFGDARRKAGEVTLGGVPYDPKEPSDAIARGVFLIPEDRRQHGLILSKAIGENILLPILRRFVRFGMLSIKRGMGLVSELSRELDVRSQGPDQIVEQLSGGNQQKVVLAKALASDPKVLLLDEPTFGVDVGTARQVIATLRDEAQKGKALVVVSSDLPELTTLSQRVLVLSGGAFCTEISAGSDSFNEAGLLRAMHGESADSERQ
jgi:ribose transport system ATP-binding protein